MNTNFQNYQTIAEVQSAISKSTTLEEGLQNSLNIIIKECNVDYAVVWYEDVKGDSVLHPYYWICPIDFTNKAHPRNEGSVGRVYVSQTSERYLEYKPNDDPFTDKDFSGVSIGSMVCVPLSNKYDKLGCVQFVKEKGESRFSEADAEVFEMLTTLIAVGIEENVHLSVEQKDQNIIISASDIVKEFKNGENTSRVLKGVNLNIYEGEFVALLGESGCGKSTLLNIIGGLDRATSGTFTFMGKDMTKVSEKELTEYRRDNIGFIFQSYNLMPNLNAKQNIDLIAELMDDAYDSKEALKLVGLDTKGKSYPSQLSGGQQQRISIARALVKKPKIIMADEPTAALDYDTSIVVLKALDKVRELGSTLIMVTHNEEITRMADRVVRFRNGKMYEVKVNKHPCKAEDLVW